MRFKFFSILFLCFCQHLFSQPLGIDPKLTKGKLANGLTYYIRENKKPEKKVELRLVVKVGSIMEDDNQQGLAHMAEHMAFNGTKNFKKNDIVSYLQSIGVEFGNDLNAYTSFDETVYILPIPTDQPSNLEKGFQILEDWAHNVSYLDEDINGERAIILEESRLGKSGEERMFKKVYPELFKGSKYANRIPIGIDSIIKTFNPELIRKFYQEWYRPELMAVVVVGDIKTDEALRMIKKHFDGLVSPANARKREYADVPAYNSNKAMVVTDKEATSYEFGINYSAKPFKPENTQEGYRKNLARQLYNSMMGARFRELVQKENPPFVFAGIGFESYAKFYEAFSISGSTGTNDVKKGMEAALEEVERVKRFGFTATELERVKKNVLSTYERLWNNRDKNESSSYAEEYIRNFTDEESIPGIEYEYELVRKLLPEITLSEVNAVSDMFKTETNRFTFVLGPEQGSNGKLPSNQEIIALLDAKANDKNIKPYEEKIISTNLLTKSIPQGKVISRQTNAALETTELVLSNGVKVSLKKTDFKNDQILFSATKWGGLTNYGLKDKFSAENATQLVMSMGIGSFTPVDLRKALAGKVASISPSITNLNSGFSGSSSKKDVETMFQLFDLYVTEPRTDSSLFKSLVQRGKSQVAMLGANPQYAFLDTLYKVLYNNNPLAPTAIPKVENYEKIDLKRAVEIYKERLGDLGGMHISIVGSFEEKDMIELLEKYVAGLPAKTKASFIDNKLRPFNGKSDFQFRRGKEDKSLIIGIIHGEVPYSEALELKMTALSDALNIIITEEMREKIQGIYGGGTNASVTKYPYGFYQFVLQLPCGPAKVDTLIAAYKHELKQLAEKGINQSYVDKVKKAWIEKYRVDVKTNEFWLSALQNISKGESTVERIIHAEKYYNQITVNDIKEAAILIGKPKGTLIAVQLPEEKK